MGKSTISMAIFHSYFDITRGYRYRSYGMTCGKVERSHRAFKMMVNFVPTGKRLRNWWERSTILMGKSTISMAIFNSYVNVYQRVGVWTIGVQPDRSDRVGPLQQLLGKAKDTLSKPLVALTLHNTCLDEEQQQAAQHILQSPGCVHAIWSPENRTLRARAENAALRAESAALRTELQEMRGLGAEAKASSWPRWCRWLRGLMTWIRMKRSTWWGPAPCSSASPCWTGAGALRPTALA